MLERDPVTQRQLGGTWQLPPVSVAGAGLFLALRGARRAAWIRGAGPGHSCCLPGRRMLWSNKQQGLVPEEHLGSRRTLITPQTLCSLHSPGSSGRVGTSLLEHRLRHPMGSALGGQRAFGGGEGWGWERRQGEEEFPGCAPREAHVGPA